MDAAGQWWASVMAMLVIGEAPALQFGHHVCRGCGEEFVHGDPSAALYEFVTRLTDGDGVFTGCVGVSGMRGAVRGCVRS